MPAPKYKPLGLADGKDVVLDVEVAYGQVTQALDAAALIAVASADAEALSTIAALWIRVAEGLVSLGEEEEEGLETHDVASKSQKDGSTFGFNNKHLEKENGGEEENDGEEEESGDGEDD